MIRTPGLFAAVVVVFGVSAATQQAGPAPASPPLQSAAAPAPAGRGPQPIMPIAAGTIAANPDRYLGTTVSITATVDQRFGDTAFSIAQAAARGGDRTVLVLAPLLTGPVPPGSSVTIIGEVVRYDPAAVSAKMKDAAPALQPDAAETFRGRPAIIAASVINSAMTDLAKKLPPPMTSGEIELNKAMKQVGPAFNALRQAVTASNTSDAGAQASALSVGFTGAAAFWKTQSHADAIQWTEDARKLTDEIASAAARSDLDAVKATVPKLQQVCTSCHTQHRERLDDGSYRYKAR